MASSNGTQVKTRDQLLVGETGTAVERERLFLSWDDGTVFTPQDFEPRKIDAMVERDGKARTLEQVLTLPLRGADWSLQPPKDDKGQTEFVNDALTKAANQGGMAIPFNLVLSQMHSARLYRRAYFEKVFKIEDGRVVYDKLAWRPPQQCRLEYEKVHGGFRGFKQYVGSEHPKANEEGHITIPPGRAFVFIHGQHRRPLEGVSDLDTTLVLYELKAKIKFLWSRFLEDQVMPKALAKDNSASDSAAARALAKTIAEAKGGGVIGLSGEQEVTTLESNGTGAGQYLEALRYLDAEMAGSVLAGFTDLTSGAASGRGSFALSKDATDLFMQASQSVLTEEEAALKSWVLADLVRWNFGVRASVPDFRFAPLVHEQAQAAIDLLQNVATSATVNSAIPREFLDALVVRVAGLIDIDQAKVEEAITKATENAPQGSTAEIKAGTDAAYKLVEDALGAQAQAA